MTTKFPWDFHPDLTEERITGVSRLIIGAYQDSVEYLVPEKGDDRWSHGCRRYAWARAALRNAAGSDDYPYLSIIQDTGTAFVFTIGDVPVKFKRTDVDEPAESIYRQSEVESRQLSLLEFAGIPDPRDLSWRIIIEDNYDFDILRGALVAVDENKTAHCFWELPRDVIMAPLVVLDDVLDEGVDLPAAEVALKSGNLVDDDEALDETAEESSDKDDQEIA